MDCGGGGQICGNNIREGTEACDGVALGGETCISQGFTGGTLKCKADCTFDTSSCTAAPITQCGNGKIEGTEQCDDGNTVSGDGCDSLCKAETGWSCTGGAGALSTCTAICGNNNTKGNELCDGTDLAGETCISQGFTGGTLKCKADCSDYNTSGCTAAPGGPTASVCGNNATETGEDCDVTDMTGETCISQGFIGGTLACNADCTFDTSGCTAAVCGNSKVEGTEVCDGTDLAGETCISQNFTGGTLKCADDCTFDTSTCTSGAVVTKEDAEEAITKAQQDIITAQGGGKNITDATLKVNEAKAALNSEDYATAKAKAEAASLAAKTATLKQAPGPSVVMISVAIIILGVGAAAAYYLLKVNPDALKFGKKEPAPAPAPETS
jgi:cysteine-rich repeat protein